MRRSRSTFPELAGAAAATAIAMSSSTTAFAQACCAGSSALTPGRLAMHEDALVGLQTHAALATGSFNDAGNFSGTPAGTSETDFEEDAFGAARVFGRGQVALLVPFVETARKNPQEGEL